MGYLRRFVFIALASSLAGSSAPTWARASLGARSPLDTPVGWVEPIFGFEFTLAKKPTFATWEERQAYISRLVDHGALVPGVERDSIRSDTLRLTPLKTVRFGTDPKVIEVTGTPDTWLGYRRDANLYQYVIFESARREGLAPHEILGGGHIHIGRVFRSNMQLLRDFFVDLNNHPSLFAGIFSYNPKQGAILADRDLLEINRYVQTIDRVDAEISGAAESGVLSLLTGLQYSRTEAINLANLGRSIETVELRISPQKSFADFLLIIKFLRARILFLTRNPHQQVRINPGPRTFAEAQAEFKELIRETGLNWDEYERFGIKSGRDNPTQVFRQPKFEAVSREQLAVDVAKLKAEQEQLEQRRATEGGSAFDGLFARRAGGSVAAFLDDHALATLESRLAEAQRQQAHYLWMSEQTARILRDHQISMMRMEQVNPVVYLPPSRLNLIDRIRNQCERLLTGGS